MNICIPFLDMLCAASILNRTDGHFKVVLAFERKLERQIRKSCVDESERRLWFINRREKDLGQICLYQAQNKTVKASKNLI